MLKLDATEHSPYMGKDASIHRVTQKGYLLGNRVADSGFSETRGRRAGAVRPRPILLEDYAELALKAPPSQTLLAGLQS